MIDIETKKIMQYDCIVNVLMFQGGFYLFNLFDEFVGGFPLLFVGLFETIAIQYIYGRVLDIETNNKDNFISSPV